MVSAVHPSGRGLTAGRTFAAALALLLAVAVALTATAEPARAGSGKAAAKKKSSKKKAKRKKRKSKRPFVSTVRPKRARIGDDVLVVGGRFTKGDGRNTVFFKRGKTLIWVKGNGLDSRTIKLKLPTKMLQVMASRGGAPIRSTFRVRVKSRKYLGEKFTRKIKLQLLPPPPGDCDQDGLADALERQVGTDICVPDTDGDGLTDFFEYSSAKDWNGGSYPYPGLFPGKRPIPHPLKADTDGDGITDDREDTDSDLLAAATEQELSNAVPQMPRCGEPLDGGSLNPFHNNVNGPKPYYSDGSEDSDGDGMVDSNLLPYLNRPFHSGENLDCDGWVPRLVFALAGNTVEDPDNPDEKEAAHHLTYFDQSLCEPGADRGPTGQCFATYKEADVKCRTSPPSAAEVQKYVWLDNYMELKTMREYGNPMDPDTDGDGVLDACDDTDGDGYTNALESYMRRDQQSRQKSVDKDDDPTTEEGKWDPLDACKPGPMLEYYIPSRPGCQPDTDTEPAGPLGGNPNNGGV